MKNFLYFFQRAATFIPAFLLIQSVSAEVQDVHPQGLFETPQAGLNVPLPRTTSYAEGISDRFHFSVYASLRYDDNIYLTPTDEQSDVILSVSPTLSFSSGESGSALNSINISYTPSFRIYADQTDRNTIDHSLRMRLSKQLPKTQLGFNLGYTRSNGSDRFVSGTIDRESLRLGFSVSHILTGKTRIDADAYYTIDNFDSRALFDNTSYGINFALMYQITGKILVGPYVSYGKSDISSGSADYDNFGYGARVQYEVSGKTALTGSVGYSGNSFSSSASDHSTVAWRLGLSHVVSPKTNIRASIYRRSKPSYNLANRGYDATGIVLSATHQSSVRLSHYATLTYENNDYFKTGPGGDALQNNDYYSFTLGSRYRFTDQLTVGANATYRQNLSNIDSNDFDNFMFGIDATYNFW